MPKGIFSRDKKRVVPNSSENTQLAIELRESINGSLINVGVLSALLLALAGAIYVDPPEPPGQCFGENMLLAEMVIVWMSMGMFFFSTIASVVLYMDIDGIPTDMLLQHLYNSQIFYSIPHVGTCIGICMTAIAYGIDIGERGGCKLFIFGMIAAPCFVLAIVALWLVCRYRRKKLFRKQSCSAGGGLTKHQLGASLIATWSDRVPTVAVSGDSGVPVDSSDIEVIKSEEFDKDDSYKQFVDSIMPRGQER